MTTLTPEQITDITDSVRKGQSWHAYQEYKNHKEQLEKLSIELESAKNHIAELEAKPVSQTYKLTFEQWLEQQHDKIDVDCGCVSTEMLMHWISVAYEAGNYPVTPDGWISCSERTPNDAQWCVVNTKYGYYVQCWSEGQGWLGDDISIPECDVINWMPLPEPPQESKSE
ncbi:DUF551 domain-containing protein [Escherichia coli]|nr:DUF551 domain-containing protein [Escherichia coli]